MISLLRAELSIDRLQIPVSEQLKYEAAFYFIAEHKTMWLQEYPGGPHG